MTLAPISREAKASGSDAVTIQPARHRQWWPAVFLDETMPVGRDTPDAWLCCLPDGRYGYGIPEDGEYAPRALNEGDVIVFAFCDRLGQSHLTFGEDREPRWSPAVPAIVNHLWDGDELIGDTPAEIAEWILDAEGPDHTAVVYLSRWSAHDARCRFTALDGPPRFVPLDPIPEPSGIFLVPPDDPQGDLLAATSTPAQER